jgi:hypothetical protein
MSGDEFLDVASNLFAPYVTGTKPANEALFRTIVGRAYYATFHLANSFIEQLGFPTSGHGTAPEYLCASKESTAKQAGNLLGTLYDCRRRADYRLTDARAIADFRNSKFVRDQLERAAEIKSLLVLRGVEPARSRIKAGITAWKQQS